MKPSRGVSLVLRGLLDLDPSSMYIHMAEDKGALSPPAQDCPSAGTGVSQGEHPKQPWELELELALICPAA